MDGQKVWNNILSTIKEQVSLSTYKTWFAGSYALDYKKNCEKNLLIIALKNNFLKEQVETKYLHTISEIAKKKADDKVEVIFVVAQKAHPQKTQTEPIFSGVPQNLIVQNRQAEALKPNYSFENFVVGSSNNLAYLAAKQVADNPGAFYNPLLLYGPTGVGKTHLLQAIGNEVLNKSLEAKVLYVTSEKFTNDYLESLTNKTCATFRSKYRTCDLLLIDDIQFLAGKESTQDEFFYTFNELFLSGKQIVLVSDRHPRELGRLKERLVSRFLGGMVANLAPADLEMRMAILKTKCAERDITLTDEIISHIAHICEGSARELEGALISILPQIRITNGKMDSQALKATLDINRSKSAQKPTAQKIIQTVCDYFKVDREDLNSASRKASLVLSRQVLMYLMRTELDLPLEQIGQYIGGRDHSTVIHGIEKIDKAISQNQAQRDEILRIRTVINN
ncbi:hypothetical protein A2165_00325 [Candidatus Curtissbacteria bacterium RBG_13_40_7]|uniref:Chromosomal replication initiator protein DnaA n=1 Tax=Candidatus Curtissbacteria bacterium RBG_13_40_7 TaxID=1797706 RepID=A0A1F5FWB8_9BACT|nr:MAG: hypothetical protein A2165_00325 [Candidatus Curtissbacteria bacterium RBG_13_40_7]